MKIIVAIEKWVDTYWIFCSVLAAALFFWLTMLFSANQPIWFDEGYSILLAKQSFGELLSLTAVDAHPPLYYLLLKVWGGMFGFGEFAVRSLSAFLMSGAIFVGLLVVRKIFSTRIALLSIPFLLLAPFILRYGYEVRMYALATLIAVSATYVLIRAQTSKAWGWWVVYAALVALGMYTLYMMVAIWLAHFVWLLITSIKSKERPFWKWRWLYAYGGAIALFLPYVPTFIHQLLNSALPGMGNQMTIPQLTNIVSTLTMYTPEWSLGGWGTIVIIAMIVILAACGVSAYKGMKKDQRKYFMLLLSLVVVPILFYALSSLPPRDPIFIVRYMAHSALFIYMIIGCIVAIHLAAGVRRYRTHSAGIVRSVLAIAGVFAVIVFGAFALQGAGNFNFERMQKPLTHLVREAAQCDTSDVVVIADDPYTFIDSAFYFDDCDLRFYSAKEIEYKGGYAMLHKSDRRVVSPAVVTAPIVIHLGWAGGNRQFVPDDRYYFVETRTFDKQVISRYQLIAE